MEIVKQQMTIWQNWMNVSDTLLQLTKNFSSFWDNIQIDYKIPSLDAQKCLKKYNWFISPIWTFQLCMKLWKFVIVHRIINKKK